MSKPGTDQYIPPDSPADNQQRSGWRFFSIAIVAANKKMSSLSIEASPIEHFSLIEGEISDNAKELEVESKDYTENSWTGKITTTPSLMARWIPIGQTHRLTAPDVRRGDLVLLYQFGDTDEYWWEEFNIAKDRNIRRLETIIWAISNNSKENEKDDKDSTYWAEWSTHRKLLHIHTSKNDGEPFTYDFQLDAKNGRFVFKDDDDNYIEFDSKERLIKLHNKDKSYVEIDKKIITLHSLDKVRVITKHFEVEAAETIKMKTKVTTIDTSQSYKLTTKDYSTVSTTWNTTVPRAVFSQDVHWGGNQTGSGTSDNHHSH